ncbi:VOC family protein [Rhizobium leguminosarum]|jgi:catechol 2,3-dioxygenase-like lactoylglutathione lyase family enzyme|uniref:VOC family protein n=1 Tax=Rhizobium TaxID=379 RepID=UPI00103DE553|nr:MULTISPECIES: VOC family protein [Rhizobium]MBY3321151.1 VOC family protein [Rhizobium laguerreae]MBY5363669.1 VOC family protein [Rhizobium leguminosarum]TBY61824.1 VOC family protein [Rhizobium leguminosarum bv. viciae]
MLHHASFGVSNIESAAEFYDAVFAPLGYFRVWEDLRPGEANQAIGYGLLGGGDKFAIKLRGANATPPGQGHHLAFVAPNREAVNLFHMAALAHGGYDNGAAGLRQHYGPDYYAAFVIDPDGNHIEAVCKTPV